MSLSDGLIKYHFGLERSDQKSSLSGTVCSEVNSVWNSLMGVNFVGVV